MEFRGELISFKLLKTDQALRIEIDVPETEQANVMQQLLNFKNKSLFINFEIEEDREIMNKLRQQAHFEIENLAGRTGVDFETTKTELFKKLFPGRSRLRSLTKLELQKLIMIIPTVEIESSDKVPQLQY